MYDSKNLHLISSACHSNCLSSSEVSGPFSPSPWNWEMDIQSKTPQGPKSFNSTTLLRQIRGPQTTCQRKLGAPGFNTLSATSTEPGRSLSCSRSFKNREPRWSKKTRSKGGPSPSKGTYEQVQMNAHDEMLTFLSLKYSKIRTHRFQDVRYVNQNFPNSRHLPSVAKSLHCGRPRSSLPPATLHVSPTPAPGAHSWDPSPSCKPHHPTSARPPPGALRCSPRSNPPPGHVLDVCCGAPPPGAQLFA